MQIITTDYKIKVDLNGDSSEWVSPDLENYQYWSWLDEHGQGPSTEWVSHNGAVADLLGNKGGDESLEYFTVTLCDSSGLLAECNISKDGDYHYLHLFSMDGGDIAIDSLQ